MAFYIFFWTIFALNVFQFFVLGSAVNGFVGIFMLVCLAIGFIGELTNGR